MYINNHRPNQITWYYISYSVIENLTWLAIPSGIRIFNVSDVPCDDNTKEKLRMMDKKL